MHEQVYCSNIHLLRGFPLASLREPWMREAAVNFLSMFRYNPVTKLILL